MKIAALDSSGLVATVAVTENGVLTGEYTTNYKKTHSQTLLPMLDELKRMIDLELESIDAIAVAKGPGSFTGLRIGAATAKGLAQALEKPIIPVPTVDALAYNLYGTDKLICPIMDARRSQVYTGLYHFVKKDAGQEFTLELHTEMAQCAISVQELAEILNVRGEEVIFLGDGVPVYASALRELLKVPFTFAPASCNRQRAACVAVLGEKLFEKGIFQTAAEHAPDYLRLSQAERERMEADEDKKKHLNQMETAKN